MPSVAGVVVRIDAVEPLRVKSALGGMRHRSIPVGVPVLSVTGRMRVTDADMMVTSQSTVGS